MNAFMLQYFRASLSMVVVILVYMIASRVFENKLSAKSFYYAGLVILFGLLLPLRLPLPLFSFMPATVQKIQESSASIYSALILYPPLPILNKPLPTKLPSPTQVIFILWALGFMVVFVYHGMRHLRFLRMVKRWSYPAAALQLSMQFDWAKRDMSVCDPRLTLCICESISSPLLMGGIHPKILLPHNRFAPEAIGFILKHELAHYKRNDLLCKACLILVLCLHWFNPFVYWFVKKFSYFLELSCDEIVCENLNKSARCEYALALLRAAKNQSIILSSLLTSFYEGEKTMKKRIVAIVNHSKKRIGALLFIPCLILTFLCSPVFALSRPTENDSALFNLVKTEAQIEQEMKLSFAEKFSNNFSDYDFSFMIVTYDEHNIPIVTDPNPPVARAVYATTRWSKNGFYSDVSCAEKYLVFYILDGKSVEVLDSSASTSVAKVKYANSTGYMKKSELIF